MSSRKAEPNFHLETVRNLQGFGNLEGFLNLQGFGNLEGFL